MLRRFLSYNVTHFLEVYTHLVLEVTQRLTRVSLLVQLFNEALHLHLLDVVILDFESHGKFLVLAIGSSNLMMSLLDHLEDLLPVVHELVDFLLPE